MNSDQVSPVRHRIVDHPFLIAGAVYLLVNGILFLIAKPANSEWEQVFVHSATVLIRGGDLYGPGINQFQLNHPFTYPPFHAMLAIPFAFLPRWLSRIGWFLVQAVALTTLWKLSWKISGGRPLNRAQSNGTEAIICLLGLIAGMRYVQGAFGHQQSDILIDALLVAGCYAWQRRRDFPAATAWGIAAAFKGPPLIMAPYLAWRGRWLAAVWTVFLAVALNLLPDVIHRAPQGIWLAEWYTRIVKPASSQVGQWYVDVTINQSIAGAAHRFFTTSWQIVNGHLITPPKNEIISPFALKMLVYGVEFALLIAAGWAIGRPLRRPADPHRAGLECALVFILMLLLSPMSHKTHFGILILAGFFVARMAIVNHDRVAAWSMLICVIVIGLLDHFIFYTALGDVFAWYGNVTCGAAALGAACFHELGRSRMPSAANDFPPLAG
jgi:hypothetical protein